MRWLILLALARTAHAQCSPEVTLPCQQPFTAWSWLPKLSVLSAWQDNGAPHALYGAELRIRYNTTRHTPDTLYTFGLGVESLRFATVEPYLELGYDPVTRLGDHVLGDAHLAIGAGVRWTDTVRAQRFALGRIAFGFLFTADDGHYIAIDGERGEVGATRKRLRSQLDVVLETAIAEDGTWRVAIGVSVDPLRILLDLVGLSQ